jgi:hypothetical protein
MEAFYDVFQLRISDVEVQLVPVDALEHWREAQTADGGSTVTHNDYRLVEKFTVNMNIMPCVLPSDTSVTRMRIEGELEEVHVWLSTSKYGRLQAILEDLATVEADQEEDIGSRQDCDALGRPGTPRGSFGGTGSVGSQSLPTTPQRSLSSTPQMHSRTLSSDPMDMEEMDGQPFVDDLDISLSTSLLTLPADARPARMALPPTWVMLDVRVGAPLLCVHLSIDTEAYQANSHRQAQRDLVCLTVQEVAVRLVLHPYDSVVDFQVGMLELEDSLNKDSQFRYLLSSQPVSPAVWPRRQSYDSPESEPEVDGSEDGTEHLFHVVYRGIGAFPNSAPLECK